jgi:hypothetical protein
LNYRAIDGRIAVNPSEHFLQSGRIDREETYELLDKIGFEVIESDILELARSCIVLSSVVRGADTKYAPAIVNEATFVRWVYAHLGIRLPPRCVQLFEIGEVVYVDEHKAGDLVFFQGSQPQYANDPEKGVGHVGVLTGDDSYIHVRYQDPSGVVEEPINQEQLEASRGVRRILFEETLTLSIPHNICLEESAGLRWVIEEHLQD